jgi:hypothetical protein
MKTPFTAVLQEVPALLSLPQNGLGSPVWIIMTGTTTQLRGYNRLISKIVPLTAASRSADLIPFMVVGARMCRHALPIAATSLKDVAGWRLLLSVCHAVLLFTSMWYSCAAIAVLPGWWNEGI